MALTFAGDGTRALKVCQQHHQAVRVATVCRCQMFKVLETASAFIGRFEWGIIGPTARSAALSDRAGGGQGHVRRRSDVFFQGFASDNECRPDRIRMICMRYCVNGHKHA